MDVRIERDEFAVAMCAVRPISEADTLGLMIAGAPVLDRAPATLVCPSPRGLVRGGVFRVNAGVAGNIAARAGLVGVGLILRLG